VLGTYSIERELGRGGMGVVYLARDPRLNRLVALKVLSGELSRHPDHLARFEREAKHLASLNHPNIAAIYGVEDVETAATSSAPAEHQRLLVLEYVPGDTLAQRVKFGALPMREALDYCRQIALALEAAHDNGVIHRDLKPGNVVITPDGQVKVLDFGLAKGSAASASDVDLALSPTFTYTPTAAGVILGTAAYMSPEQARGKPVDKRTDIWAFGCVLFECLTGRQFFQGETISDTIARILERDPDWSLLPPDTPPKVRELLRRCLEKDVKKRQRDIGDVRIELEEAIAARSSSSRMAAVTVESGLASQRRWRSPLILAAAGVLVGALAGIGLWSAVGPRAETGGSTGPVRLAVSFPANIRVIGAGIMPDGGTLIIRGFRRNPDGTEDRWPRLFTRRLDSYEVRLLPGTEDANNVTASPESRWVAFISRISEQAAQRRISKVLVDGSAPPVVLGDWNDEWNPNFVWLEDNDLLIAARAGDEASFFRLPTGNGPPKPPTKLDTGTAAVFPGFVNALPGGRGVFAQFTSYGSRGYQQDVWLLDLQTGKASLLLENAGRPEYVSTGHVVFSRGDTLHAAPFDLRNMTRGDVVALSGGIRTPNAWAPGDFSVSRTGTLMYAPGERIGADRRLVVVDASGAATPFVADRRSYDLPPAVSTPDGRRAAVVVANERATYEIWLAERNRSIVRAIAFPDADASSPVWSPDGLRIAYSRVALSADDGVYIERADGGEPPKLLLKGESQQVFLTPTAWAPDDSGILVARAEAGRSRLFFVPLAGAEAGKLRPLRATRYREVHAQFSPDGKLVAFVADDSGRFELYVAPYRNGTLGAAVPVSTDLCGEFDWSLDGRRLLFCEQPQTIVSVTVQAEPLAVAAPVVLYDLRKLRIVNWDVLPDGSLLAIQKGDGEDDITTFNLVLNWFDELRARMGAR
jgi:serine/threonine-protein kinase